MNLLDYINQGGFIIYILIALNIVGYTIMIYKLAVMIKIKIKKDKIYEDFLEKIKAKYSNIDDKSVLVSTIKDEIVIYVKALEFGLNTIKIIATVSPLFGLLGTVIGISDAFNTISTQGLGSPKAFASGIYLALITTIGGLIVAIPHYIGYNYLVGILDSLEVSLEKFIFSKIFNK